MIEPVLFFLLIINAIAVFAQEEAVITIIPQPYEKGLKNPMMGFTTSNVEDHSWVSVSQKYLNRIINNKSITNEKTNQFNS